MIVSEDIKLNLKAPITNNQIDKALKEKELNVLRWAITDINNDIFTIRIAKIIENK